MWSKRHSSKILVAGRSIFYKQYGKEQKVSLYVLQFVIRTELQYVSPHIQAVPIKISKNIPSLSVFFSFFCFHFSLLSSGQAIHMFHRFQMMVGSLATGVEKLPLFGRSGKIQDSQSLNTVTT